LYIQMMSRLDMLLELSGYQMKNSITSGLDEFPVMMLS